MKPKDCLRYNFDGVGVASQFGKHFAADKVKSLKS